MAKKFANILGLSNAFGYNSETNTYLPYLLLDSVKNEVNTNTICFVEADENDEGYNIKGHDIKAGDTFIITQKNIFGFYPKDGIISSGSVNQNITSWRPIFINDDNIAEIEFEYEDPESGDTILKEIGNEYQLNLLDSDYLSVKYNYDDENNIVDCKYELDISKLNSLYEFTEYVPGNKNVSIDNVDTYEKAITVNGYKWNPDNESFSEGTNSRAKGYNSHAEGDNSKDGTTDDYDSIRIREFDEEQILHINGDIGIEMHYYTPDEIQFTNIEIYTTSNSTIPVGRITFLKYYKGYQSDNINIPECRCFNLEFYNGYNWDNFEYDKHYGDGVKIFKYKYISGSYGDYSHSEGVNCIAYEVGSYASGCNTYSQGQYSHTEGNTTNASGNYSHAEGESTTAQGVASHSEGNNTKAIGDYSHTEGYFTETKNFAEHAEGIYNLSNTTDYGEQKTKTLSSIGIGNDQERKNAFEVMQNGDVYINDIGNYDGKNAVYNENGTTVYTLQHVVNNLDDNLQNLSNTVSSLDSKIDNEINEINTNLSSRIDEIDELNTNLSSRIDTIDNEIDELNTNLSSRIDTIDSEIDGINTNLSDRIDIIENSNKYTSGDNINIQDNKISALGYIYNPLYEQGSQDENYDKLFCIKAKEKVEVEVDENIQFSGNDFIWETISTPIEGDESVVEGDEDYITTLYYTGSEYENLTYFIHIGDTLIIEYYNADSGEDESIQTTVKEVDEKEIVVNENCSNIDNTNALITIETTRYLKDANNIVVNDEGLYVKGLDDFYGVSLSNVKSLQTIISDLQTYISELQTNISDLQSTIEDLTNRIEALEPTDPESTDPEPTDTEPTDTE